MTHLWIFVFFGKLFSALNKQYINKDVKGGITGCEAMQGRTSTTLEVGNVPWTEDVRRSEQGLAYRSENMF